MQLNYCNLLTFMTTLHSLHNLKEQFNPSIMRQCNPLRHINSFLKIQFILWLKKKKYLVSRSEMYLTPGWWLQTQSRAQNQSLTNVNKWKSLKIVLYFIFTYFYRTKLNSSHHHGSSVCWIWTFSSVCSYKGICHESKVFGRIGKKSILIPITI